MRCRHSAVRLTWTDDCNQPKTDTPDNFRDNMQKILVATLFALSTSASAGTLRSDSDIRSFTDGVMGSVAADNLDGAFTQISEYLLLSDAELAPIKAQLQLQMPNFLRRFGAPIGFDFIESKEKGSSLLSMTYVARYEKHAMPWTFYFYKTPSGWMLNTFRFDESFIRLFPN